MTSKPFIEGLRIGFLILGGIYLSLILQATFFPLLDAYSKWLKAVLGV